MTIKSLYRPGDMISALNGDIGMVLSPDQFRRIKGRLRQGKRLGAFFAPGCCDNPDYITKIPVIFRDGSYNMMRSMNIKKREDISEDIIQEIRRIIEEDEEMSECIFCKIVKGEIPAVVVYEDEKVMAFEDINPISQGHTLIIPKSHAENLWEIPEEDLTAIHIASKKVGKAIMNALNATGIALLQLNGKGANQVIMHYHLHLIPRLEGTPPLPVSSWELKSGNMDEIKKIAEKIKAQLG